MSDFIFQNCYTRDQIYDKLGGSKVSYLPRVGEQVVCACLRTDTNPDAPNVILPGTGADIQKAAELLGQQQEPVPTFLKRHTNRWQFVGMFQKAHVSREQRDIQEHAKRSCRDDVSMVIFMTAVSNSNVRGLEVT